MRLKKLLFILVIMLVGTLTVSAGMITDITGTMPAVCDGSKNNPYEVWTAEELRWVVREDNSCYYNGNYSIKLMADIDLSSICGPGKGSWVPLSYGENGTNEYSWGGVFDGNGHTISGFYISGVEDCWALNIGFFGSISGAEIKNLTLEGKIVCGRNNTGGLVGTSKSLTSSIVNCVSHVDIEMLGRYDECVGGIIGKCASPNLASANNNIDVILDRCSYYGKITSINENNNSYKGTLIGYWATAKTIKGCIGTSDGKIPLVGHSWKQGTLKNCISDYALIGVYENTGSKEGTMLKDNLCVELVVEALTDVRYESNSALETGELESGAACYKMNNKLGGQYFTQTLGTDAAPYANNERGTVYRVKKYSDCYNDLYNYTFSNSPEDITNERHHTFDAEHAYCTRCGKAVNPDYGIEKDTEGYYLAGSVDDIKWLWNLVNVSFVTDANIKLTADIDMNNEAMEPLALYKGTLDGQGHILSNINISCSGVASVGLVGKLEGTICNLTLTGNVEGAYATYLGAFAGYVWSSGKIKGVRNDCTVKATGTVGGDVRTYIGGVAGISEGKINYAINNGAVVDASVCTGTLRRYIAGVAGYVSSNTDSHLVNNGVVGATGTASPTGKGAPVVNILDPANYSNSYNVVGVSNPGLEYFSNDNKTSTDTWLMPTKVGSGELAWKLAGKDYDAEDASTLFFGQTIGTDLVPYPGVSAAHEGVYNKKLYYTCSDYTEYSNSSVDGNPGEHTYDPTDHYCTACYSIDENHVPKDKDTKVYLISTEDQFMIFNKALYAARGSSKPMKYASASIQKDLDFSSNSLYSEIDNLHGRIHGNGHTINLGSKEKYGVVRTIEKDGVVEYLNVVFNNTATKCMVSNNYGQMIGCNVKGGMPAKESYGIVSNCSGENLDGYVAKGRFSNCLVKNYTDGTANCYRLYNSNVAGNEAATYTEIPLEKGNTGELAYQMSHGEGSSEWGQKLDTDTAPLIYYGQTPASDTYVTSLTTYSVDYPEGKVEYMNAGMGLEAAPGNYKVCKDTESWTTHPAYNFIIDNGDGTYSAKHINLDPTAQHYLPFEVNADKFSFKVIDKESGDMVDKTYTADEMVPLVFPFNIAASNINGKIYLFDGYDIYNDNIVFKYREDLGQVPANLPIIVKATGGAILKEDLTNVAIMPMIEAQVADQLDAYFMTSFKSESLPYEAGDEIYFKLNGDATKAICTTDADHEASQFSGYFSLPYLSATIPGSEVEVVLKEGDELQTSCLMEWDLFDLPYGINNEGTWSKVEHLSSSNQTVFHGNDINVDNHADLTGFNALYLHGTANQKYYLYFNGSEPTEVTLDDYGDYFVDLDNFSGRIYLRGIRTDGEKAGDAFAKVYKIFLNDEGVAISGKGTLTTADKGYSLYDATAIKDDITLEISNPNALVLGDSNIKGASNLMTPTTEKEQGFTAETLKITDGYDFCYDFSAACPNVKFTRTNISAEDQYATAILPFAVNASSGIYQYVDCDGSNVYFKTPETTTIPPYTPIVINVEKLNEITISGENLESLIPNGIFNLTPASERENGMKFGFVTERQEGVSLSDNDEVNDYNVYGYSLKSHQFVRAVNTFSISPFRAFFLLPKSSKAEVKGYAAAAASAPSALSIVIDGKSLDENTANIGEVFTNEETGEGVDYNLLGIPVGPNYRGLVIRNGKKIIIK